MKTYKQFVTEAGLSRIHKHIEEYVTGAITGFRGENTRAQNRANNRDIKAYLKTKGYGLIAVAGNYIENFGSENAKEKSEESFFVVDLKEKGKNELEKHLRKLGERFDQDSILVVPKGGKGAYLVGTSKRDDAYPDYGKKEIVGNSKFGKVAGEFLSRIRGREFAFEDVTFPGTINGLRGWKILADKIEEE